MGSKSTEENDNKNPDQLDGIIPPVIIRQTDGFSSFENDTIVFKNNNTSGDEPQVILSTDTLPSAPPPYSTISSSEDTIPATQSVPKTIPQRILAFIIFCIRNITLEPGEFMFSLGGGIAYTCYSQFTLDKACYDRGYNQTICDNVTAYDDIYDQISHDVANFNVWTTAAQSVFPCLIAFYAGAWADIFGRKVIIYLFGIASVLDYFGLLLNALFFDWPLVALIPTTIFRSLIGGFGIWLAATYAFLADISPPNQLAFRMGMLHLTSGLAKPIGPPIGAFLYKTGGYTVVFGTALGVMVLGAVLLYWRIKSFDWKPKVTENQSKRSLFHWRHAWEAIEVTFRRRNGPNRLFALLTISVFFFQVMPYFGEGAIAYLYVQKRYDWGIVEYSTYSTVTSIASLLGQAVLIPLLNLLKVREPVILLLVMLSVFIRHIVKGLATDSWMYYLGAMIDILGGYASSITRAMLSFCVPKEELGKIYSVLAFIDGLLPFAVSEVYAQIWIATDNTVPGTIFFLSAAITSIGIVLCVVVTILLKGRKMTDLTKYIETTEEPNNTVYPNIPPPPYREVAGHGWVSSF